MLLQLKSMLSMMHPVTVDCCVDGRRWRAPPAGSSFTSTAPCSAGQGPDPDGLALRTLFQYVLIAVTKLSVLCPPKTTYSTITSTDTSNSKNNRLTRTPPLFLFHSNREPFSVLSPPDTDVLSVRTWTQHLLSHQLHAPLILSCFLS